MTTLKPCPFCGEGDELYVEKTQDGYDYRYVRCAMCGSQGEQCSKRDVAIKCWNTRKGE